MLRLFFLSLLALKEKRKKKTYITCLIQFFALLEDKLLFCCRFVSTIRVDKTMELAANHNNNQTNSASVLLTVFFSACILLHTLLMLTNMCASLVCECVCHLYLLNTASSTNEMTQLTWAGTGYTYTHTHIYIYNCLLHLFLLFPFRLTHLFSTNMCVQRQILISPRRSLTHACMHACMRVLHACEL